MSAPSSPAGGSRAAGTLYVVSTPIGNLQDITYRAVATLGRVAVIAAEDTRHTRRLLQEFGLDARLLSYHDHNERQRTPELLALLRAGTDVAMVADAGTPTIADPGYVLIGRCIESGIPVCPIPGASALLAALAGAGLPTDRVAFEGFLPAKKGRQQRLAALAQEPRTIVLFEGPHRLVRTLTDLQDTLGDRRAAVARELTKLHEEFRRGRLGDLLQGFSQAPPRGECVIVVEGIGTRRDRSGNSGRPTLTSEV